jgi:hypothetical protein
MPQIESLLSDVEPILRDSDDTFQFSHPSFQDVLTANQFALEINSGQLSIKDAWMHYWSYTEDKKLWQLEDLADDCCRSALPSALQIIKFTIPLIDRSRAKELYALVTNSYFVLEERKKSDAAKKTVSRRSFLSRIAKMIKLGKSHEEISKKEDYRFNPFLDTMFSFFAYIADVAKDEDIKHITDLVVDSIENTKDEVLPNRYFFDILGRIGNMEATNALLRIIDDPYTRINQIQLISFLPRYQTKYARIQRNLAEIIKSGYKAKTRAVSGYLHIPLENPIEDLEPYIPSSREIKEKKLKKELDATANEDISKVIEKLEDKAGIGKHLIIEELGKRKDERAVMPLIKYFREDIRNESCIEQTDIAIINAFKNIGDARAIEVLKLYLKKNAGRCGGIAAVTLSDLGYPEPTKYLIQYMVNGFNLITKDMAESLANGEKVEDYMRRKSMDLEYYLVPVAHAFPKLKDSNKIPLLIDALNKYRTSVRRYISIALGELKAEAATPLLIDYLKEKDIWGEPRAAEALGKIGSKEAVSLLVERFEDKSSINRLSFVIALGEIDEPVAEDAFLDYYLYESFSANALVNYMKNKERAVRIVNAINSTRISDENRELFFSEMIYYGKQKVLAPVNNITLN